MEFFNHVQKVYSETDHDTLNLDIPLAIFMIKLLSIKVDFSHFRDENKFNEYMKSDRPLKFRYYLQVKFGDEMKKATEVAKQKLDEENKYIESSFKTGIDTRIKINPKYAKYSISYEKRKELYDKYLKNKDFDEVTQDKISKWIEPDMVNIVINQEIRYLINNEMVKKYGNNPEKIKNYNISFMNKFSDKESVEKLLYSMRDVYILGLV